jgi:DNA-directed RNA polymerase specialized sigma24 family protein
MSVARAAGSPVDHACDHLYRRHQASLVNFARHRGCDEHEAWDVVQELFLRVFRLGMVLPLSSRTEEMQRTWLLRTLRWMLINLHRRRTRLRRGGGSALESLEHLLDEGFDIACGDTPEELHDRQWAMHIVERGLLKLRAGTRPAEWLIMQNAIWGTDSSTGAQRVASHRARLRLRDCIRREASYEDLLEATQSQN